MKKDKATQHGGKRTGAGRPKGSGKFNEPTTAIRVPQSQVTHIESYLKKVSDINNSIQASKVETIARSSEVNNNDALTLPLYSCSVAAGYPTPAEDHIETTMDLNHYLVQRPDSTFILRVEGESMRDAGIMPDDLLIVDRSIQATHNKIVIAAIDGELTVKRLYHRGEMIKLMPENPDYPDIEIESEADLIIWGVVTGSLRRFQGL